MGFSKRTYQDIIVVAAVATLLGIAHRVNEYAETPTILDYYPYSRSVYVADDNAVGMTAVATYNGQNIPMTAKDKGARGVSFMVPSEATESGKFTVEVEDRHGHKARKTFKDLEGIFVDEKSI